ncbi:unnamed protein product [Closterium sp. NIES-65]|nr:unnamed protein product [Closterium sp. NIES-65]
MEERKRISATQLHLMEEVEQLRHLVKGGSTDDKTNSLLLTREEQLEAYRENERERPEVFAGCTTELQGEIPSPYLSTKVKMRKERTLIEEVRFRGERCRGSQAVFKAASAHFEEAFKEVQVGPHSADADFVVDRVLPSEAAAKLGAPWTEPEVKAALIGLPKGKSPGQDGLPAELFVSHWDLLGECFMEFVRGFERTGVLPKSLTTALTKLLHKKGEKDLLTNYRPITLLTTVYKVLAKVLVNKLKKELHQVISKEQHGFIPGRSLADAIVVVADVIKAAYNDGEDWYLLLVDFQKAYDTVSRPFLFRTLEKLGLPGNFVRWTEGRHKGAGTRMAINGWLGERMEMQRGVRQGCPLAPYLFLCALEPLCAEIRGRDLGVRADGGDAVSYVGYADETSSDPPGRSATALNGSSPRLARIYLPPEELWAKICKTCDNYVSKGEATADKTFVLWSGELARLPKKEGGLGLIDSKDRLDSMAIRQVGMFLTEQDTIKRWLSEKAAAL